MYKQLLRPTANEATKHAMEAWAREVSQGIVDQSPDQEHPWEIKGYNQISCEMVGSWKRVVFFVKTNWEGEIQDIRITFIFKVEGLFHVSGMVKAVVTALPEVAQDKELNDTPAEVQDAIIETTRAMDRFRNEVGGKTPEDLRNKLVREVPSLIEDALGCSVITALTLPHLRRDLPPK